MGNSDSQNKLVIGIPSLEEHVLDLDRQGYRLQDLERYIESCIRKSTSDTGRK